jgi:hypothetical protein
MEQLLNWCVAEQQKLRQQITDIEAVGKPEAAAEIEVIRKHLANLDFVIWRLRDGASKT